MSFWPSSFYHGNVMRFLTEISLDRTVHTRLLRGCTRFPSIIIMINLGASRAYNTGTGRLYWYNTVWTTVLCLCCASHARVQCGMRPPHSRLLYTINSHRHRKGCQWYAVTGSHCINSHIHWLNSIASHITFCYLRNVFPDSYEPAYETVSFEWHVCGLTRREL